MAVTNPWKNPVKPKTIADPSGVKTAYDPASPAPTPGLTVVDDSATYARPQNPTGTQSPSMAAGKLNPKTIQNSGSGDSGAKYAMESPLTVIDDSATYTNPYAATRKGNAGADAGAGIPGTAARRLAPTTAQPVGTGSTGEKSALGNPLTVIDAAKPAGPQRGTIGSPIPTGSMGAPVSATQPTTPATATTPAATTAETISLNFPGLSDATSKNLSDLINNGYQPSAAVDAALGELNDIIENQPGAFESQYAGALKAIMDQIINREDFEYDMTSDPAYQQYAQQYQQAGKLAMQDTMGQSAAMTGGYGSSYSSTAGNQAYQGYLTQLNNLTPELRAQALAEYQAEGDQMTEAYGLTSDAYSREYSQYQDDYSKWASDRDYASGRYDSERGFDYSGYQDDYARWSDAADRESAQYNSDRDDARALASAMIAKGNMPDAATLKAAGWTAAQVKLMLNGSGGSSSSSRSSTSSGSSSSSSGATTTPKSTSTGALSDAAVSAKATKAYTEWAKTGKQPDWSSYSAADRAKLNKAFRSNRESTV